MTKTIDIPQIIVLIFIITIASTAIIIVINGIHNIKQIERCENKTYINPCNLYNCKAKAEDSLIRQKNELLKEQNCILKQLTKEVTK